VDQSYLVFRLTARLVRGDETLSQHYFARGNSTVLPVWADCRAASRISDTVTLRCVPALGVAIAPAGLQLLSFHRVLLGSGRAFEGYAIPSSRDHPLRHVGCRLGDCIPPPFPSLVMWELPALNDLQKRHEKNNVLVADVTTYKANSFLDPPTHSKIDAVLNQTRMKKAPDLSMVITSDEILPNYGVADFPIVAVIDKGGRLRYVGSEIDFDEDEPIGRLVVRLAEE
jgi:hypothetical protein